MPQIMGLHYACIPWSYVIACSCHGHGGGVVREPDGGPEAPSQVLPSSSWLPLRLCGRCSEHRIPGCCRLHRLLLCDPALAPSLLDLEQGTT